MRKFFVLLLALTCLLAFAGCGDARNDPDDPDRFMESYIGKMRGGASGEDTCIDVMPKGYIDEMKDSGLYGVAVGLQELAAKNFDIDMSLLEKKEKLTAGQLDSAQEYFKKRFNCDVKITNGYEYTFATAVERYGETQERPSEMCAFFLEGEGWKVIKIPANSLAE